MVNPIIFYLMEEHDNITAHTSSIKSNNMKIFISSVIRGMEEYRDAAQRAVKSLGYEPIVAEEFPASSKSPRGACLEGVRSAKAVILLMGDRYGDIQSSGASATHEEYEEAKDRCQVFPFIQTGVTPEEKQAEFIQEVQHYDTGRYTAPFSTPEELKDAIVGALHQWSLSLQSGTQDAKVVLDNALSYIPSDNGRYSGGSPELCVVISGGPVQTIIRPSQLGDAEFIDQLSQMACYGSDAIFTRKEGIEDRIEGDDLLLIQKSASLLISEQGAISMRFKLERNSSHMPVIIEEDVLDKICTGLKFAEKILQHIDPRERLSYVTIVASIKETSYHAWRTIKEHETSPHSGSLGMGHNEEDKTVHLKPAHQTRGQFRVDAQGAAKDLTALLKRKFS